VRTQVVKVIKGVASLDQAVALAAGELEAQGHRDVRHVGHDRHPNGVRKGHDTWVIQFEIDRG
jgi:hypothetical protein